MQAKWRINVSVNYMHGIKPLSEPEATFTSTNFEECQQYVIQLSNILLINAAQDAPPPPPPPPQKKKKKKRENKNKNEKTVLLNLTDNSILISCLSA